MKKRHLIDGLVGFVVGFVLFLVVPFIAFHGSWGIVGYDAVQSLFPSLANDAQGTLMVLCIAYILVDCILFFIYRELPFYKRRHGKGLDDFLFALGSFLVGALLGYGVVLFIGIASLGAAGGAGL